MSKSRINIKRSIIGVTGQNYFIETILQSRYKAAP